MNIYDYTRAIIAYSRLAVNEQAANDVSVGALRRGQECNKIKTFQDDAAIPLCKPSHSTSTFVPVGHAERIAEVA